MEKSDNTMKKPNASPVTGPRKSRKKTRPTVEYLGTPVKSANDNKTYRVIRLPNNLTALLISNMQSLSGDQINIENGEDNDDEYTDKASTSSGVTEVAKEEENTVPIDLSNKGVDSRENEHPQEQEKLASCSLCIGVGIFSDPPEVPGMSHILKRLVFKGSVKYPQEDDFASFVEERDGHIKAWGDCERTTFHFEIHEKHLFAGLDRFAQFFISPLLTRDTIMRERESYCTGNFHRKEQLLSSLAKSGHPAKKFSTGHYLTLRDNAKLYDELYKFRLRNYIADRMTLALQARLPMDKLEQYVKHCFSMVPSNRRAPDDFMKFKGIQAFDAPQFNRIYKMKPNFDDRVIELTWMMPPMQHLYKCEPSYHVSWIIGHKGKGSLISYLRKKLWCSDCYCGTVRNGFSNNSMYALFNLRLILTKDGQEHLKDVLDAAFSYISLVRRSGPQKRIYDEIHQIKETSFRFTISKNTECTYTKNLAEGMHVYEPTDYITGSKLHLEYSPIRIKACMDALTPDNVNIMFLDKEFDDAEFDKVEPLSNTKYRDTEIPNIWIQQWRTIEPLPDFHLPEPNIFITDDFSLVSLPEEVPKYPIKIHSDTMSEVWFRPDPKSKIPECYMYYYLISPMALTSPANEAMMDVLVKITRWLLNEELYSATTAQLRYAIYVEDKGVVVKVSGFNQKLPLVLLTIMKCIADCPNSATQRLFGVMKATKLRGCYNTFIDPTGLLDAVSSSILKLVHWTSIDHHAALSGVDFDKFQMFAKQFLDHIYLQCLVQGNITKEEVIQNTKNCIEILKCGSLLPNTLPQLRGTQIPLGARCCRVRNFNNDANSIVTNYYQSDIGTFKLSAIIQLIVLIQEPLFDQHIVREMLEYYVECDILNAFGILGYSIKVRTQAHKFTTEDIDEGIEKFLRSFLESLKNMSEEELSIAKDGLIKLKQGKILNLCAEIDRNWNEILTEKYIFNRLDREIDAINGTNIAELREWMESHILGGTNLRKLSIQIVGRQQGDVVVQRKFWLEYMTDMPNEKTPKPSKYYITDIEDYKMSLHVFPATHTSTE